MENNYGDENLPKSNNEKTPQHFIHKPSVDSNTIYESRIARLSTVEQRSKLMKLLKLSRCLNLKVLFRVLGTLIGTYPWAFLISSLIIASLSLGMVKLKLQNRVRDGYTPSTSLSRYENDVIKEFFGSVGDPLVTSVLIRAKDGGSMHRIRHLKEAVQLHSFILNNISAEFLPADKDPTTTTKTPQLVKYVDICGPFCDANIIIDHFFESLTNSLALVRADKKLSASKNLTYPIAKINGYDLHLERNFFGVSQISFDIQANESLMVYSLEDLAELKDLSKVTSISFIQALLLSFRGDISYPDDETKMALWEMTLYKFMREHFNNSLVEVLVIGNEIVDYEMNRDAQKTAPFFAMGFLFMFSFAFLTLMFSSFYYNILDWAKFTLALCISLCPTLAITCTFGVCALVGLRTNSVMLIMPFLICGIGVNDAFLICHSWYRLAHCNLSIANRLGLVLEEVGPSITITTLTNVITFGIGALTPTPEISLFCLATAIALGFAYIFTVTLFTSFLYFATVVEINAVAAQKGNKCAFAAVSQQLLAIESTKSSAFSTNNNRCSNFQPKLHRICKNFGDFYCHILRNKYFLLILIFGTLVYWYFAVLGTVNINAKLDTEKILPKDCPILEPHRIISHMVWKEYYPITILVNKPLDIRSKTQLANFYSMVDEFEALNKCRGKEFTILWLRDYIKYSKMVQDYGFDYYIDENYDELAASERNSKNNKTLSLNEKNNTPKTETGLDFLRFNEFLSSPFYKHYAPFVKLVSNTSYKLSEVPISKFWFIVTYHNTTDWQDRIDLMQEWRRLAKKYETALNVTVWEVNGMFIDQMLSLKSLTLQTTIMTLACMTVVCAIFIQNPLSVASAVVAIGSISVGVIGFLSWWDLNLDPATLCAVLMSIGMSVDFTAHICYHFQIKTRQKVCGSSIVEVPLKTSNDKLRNTISSVAWPMSQAGLSTVICVLPLTFLQNYIPLVFVKTVFLVVLWGMFHGIVLMPAFLASIPPKWLELNCYSMLFKNLSSHSLPSSLQSSALIAAGCPTTKPAIKENCKMASLHLLMPDFTNTKETKTHLLIQK